MSVYKRGDIYWIEFQFNGVQVRRSARTKSKREAEAFERRLREQVASDARAKELGLPPKRTFGQALEKWVLGGAPKSMYSHINNVRPYMNKAILTSAVEAAEDMKAAMLADGLSNLTVNRRLAVVRRVLNLSFKWGWLTEPLGKKIELLSESGSERHIYLARDQVTNLVLAMQNKTAQTVLLVAAYTGLRRGEILGLRPHNWRKPAIVLDAKTKGGKPRAVPLVSELHLTMDSLPFKLTEWELRQDFEQARAQLDMEHVRFHDLRHTFASWLVENPETPLTVVRDILGHSSLAVTSRYSHLRTEALSQAIAALEIKSTGSGT